MLTHDLERGTQLSVIHGAIENLAIGRIAGGNQFDPLQVTIPVAAPDDVGTHCLFLSSQKLGAKERPQLKKCSSQIAASFDAKKWDIPKEQIRCSYGI